MEYRRLGASGFTAPVLRNSAAGRNSHVVVSASVLLKSRAASDPATGKIRMPWDVSREALDWPGSVSLCRMPPAAIPSLRQSATSPKQNLTQQCISLQVP